MKTNDMLPKTKGRKKKEVIAENPPNKIIIENDYEEIYEPSLGHHLQLYRGDCLQKMKEIHERLGLKELSMGMSNDYLKAVKFNSSYLRIGSRIFGQRNITN